MADSKVGRKVGLMVVQMVVQMVGLMVVWMVGSMVALSVVETVDLLESLRADLLVFEKCQYFLPLAQ